MMTRLPDVTDTDEQIRAWAMSHNHQGLPKQCVELVGAVTIDQLDVAVVHWDLPGHPVTREGLIETVYILARM